MIKLSKILEEFLLEQNNNFEFSIINFSHGLGISFSMFNKENNETASSCIGQKRGKGLLLINVKTDSNYLRQGLAFLLIQNIIKWTKQNNFDFLFLEVMKHNQKALNLYKKLGFEIVEENPMAYAMELQLNNINEIKIQGNITPEMISKLDDEIIKYLTKKENNDELWEEYDNIVRKHTNDKIYLLTPYNLKNNVNKKQLNSLYKNMLNFKNKYKI